ncbi:MAG: hypothetical protein ACOC22_02520 [bacterium]
MTIFEAYKPFRNKIRQLELFDTLYVLWLKSIYSQFDRPLPNDFKVITRNTNLKSLSKSEIMLYNGLDHELDIILIEALKNADEISSQDKSLKNPNVLRKVLKDLRDLNNFITEKNRHKDDIFRSLLRLAHQQFPWQEKLNSHSLIPYYYIYNDPEVARIVEKVIGLNPFDIFIIGIYYTFRFQKQFFLPKKPVSDRNVVSTDKLRRFIQEFSIDLDSLREKVRESHFVDEKYLFMLNPLRANPIISYGENILSPMPIYIYWAITKGLYYRLCNHNSFGNYYGDSFQKFIGKLLERVINNNNLKVFSESEYYVGKERKDSVDWIIKDNDEILFIECKTKRMTRLAKFSIEPEELERDLNKMSEFLKQTYKTYMDYEKNLYPKLKFDSDLKCRILILTLENWFIDIDETDYKKLDEQIKHHLPSSVLGRTPYYVQSMPYFINDIQIINKVGLKKYFDLFVSNELQAYKKNFEFKDLFIEDFDEKLLKPLKENGA